MKRSACFFVLIIVLQGLTCVDIKVHTRPTNRNWIKFNQSDFNEVEKLLINFNLKFLEKVTPLLYIYKYEGKYLKPQDIKTIKKVSNGKIHNIRVIHEHHIELNVVNTVPTTTTRLPGHAIDPDITPENELPCHGMGIKQAWEAGYNGSGVVVAVTDLGVDVNITDLKPNINIELSHNFVNNNSDVHQEHYHNRNYVKSLDLTDHGNRCAGLIAAVHGNDVCSSGIAFGSKIAVLKVENIDEQIWEHLSDEFLLEALVWRHNEIDVYSNSWQYSKAFVGLDEYQIDTLSFGTLCGRNTKGSIFVFPAGPVAEGFANSRYTLAVNSFNRHGGIPDFAQSCACTLTSTYGEGTNYNVPHMKTTSTFNGCTEDFKGTSASVAMVSAMVALALGANKNLTWRDVQHLIVGASYYKGHVETNNFTMNAAGHFFHSVFGFGLLNAYDLVVKASNWTSVGHERSVAAHSDKCKPSKCCQQYVGFAEWISNVQIECGDTSCCVEQIEHVMATISYKTPNETHLVISLKSPYNTVSILMQDGQSVVKQAKNRTNVQFLSVNFWDENPTGKWELSLRQYKFNNEKQNTFQLLSFELNVTGTSRDKSSVCSNAQDIYGCSHRIKPTTIADTTDNTSRSPSEEKPIISTGAIISILVVVVSVVICFLVFVYYYIYKRERLLEIFRCLINQESYNPITQEPYP